MLLRMCLALFVVAEAWAQPAPRATPPQKGDGPLTRASFSAKGLNSEDDLTDLFVGNFGAVAFDRGSLSFSALFQAYLEAFSSQCGAYLPPNKVKMTRQVCADPSIQTLPNEPPPPPHPCYSWRTESLGFADPALYAARKQLDVEQGPNQVKDLISMTRSVRPAVGIFQANTDMLALVRINACSGPGLRRFQDNLALFSMGKPPLLLPGEPPPGSGSQPPGVLVDSDYSRLVEDLVADEAKVWSVNRYVPGSTSQVIVAHDPTGQPSMIRAKYFFTSLMKSGRMQGSVNVSFTAGMPASVHFFRCAQQLSDAKPQDRSQIFEWWLSKREPLASRLVSSGGCSGSASSRSRRASEGPGPSQRLCPRRSGRAVVKSVSRQQDGGLAAHTQGSSSRRHNTRLRSNQVDDGRCRKLLHLESRRPVPGSGHGYRWRPLRRRTSRVPCTHPLSAKQRIPPTLKCT